MSSEILSTAITHEAQQLFQLMFKTGETISVSPNKYGYHSLPLEKVVGGQAVMLLPTPESCESRGITWEHSVQKCLSNDILMCALNPIRGFRTDAENFRIDVA